MDSVISQTQRILSTYPRSRPPLTPDHEAIFVKEYSRNRSGTGMFRVTAWLESWMHKELARRPRGAKILELGAGTLNHLQYESRYEVYDVIEPFHDLWQGKSDRNRVTRFFDDIGEIEGTEVYDRVLSVAVLEHLTDLPAMVARSALLLKPDGRFQAGIPTEGGFLWGLAWRTTTGLVYRLRTGLPYATVIRHEHINDEDEILDVVRHFFDDVRVRRFPSSARHLSFYTALEAMLPRYGVALDHLRASAPQLAVAATASKR